jgi:hypothetical protein
MTGRPAALAGTARKTAAITTGVSMTAKPTALAGTTTTTTMTTKETVRAKFKLYS